MRLCRCCSCCRCCESSSSVVDSTELLHSKGIEEGSQYYTVRRISSFGRAVSQEDLDGSYQDLSGAGKKDVTDIHNGSLAFMPSGARCNGAGEHQTGVGDEDSWASSAHSHTKKKPNWRKALHSLKPRTGRFHSKSPPPVSPTYIPPITISSPKTAEDVDSENMQPKRHTLALPQTKLRHVLTMSDVSSIGLTDQPQVFRFKSRSMQDINSSGETPGDGKFSEEARKLARSVGLDISLYPIDPPAHHRSAEALTHTDSPHDDSTQEHKCGRIDFFITYYPKDKKLLVNVTQLEGLPPRNDYQDYTAALKVQLLPPEKSAKTAKLEGQEIDEDFYFSLKETHGKVVRLSVYDADRMGKYDAIGHALIHLDSDVLSSTRLYTMKLYKQSEPDVMPGSILLTMSYDSDAQRLTVLVTAASKLITSHLHKAVKPPDKMNTYVKLAHYKDGEKAKSKKSAIVSHDQNPKYNHQFFLKMPGIDAAESYVVISIMLKEVLKKDEVIGRIKFGPYCYTAERSYTLWGQVMMGEKTVSGWYKLYL